MEAIKTKSCFFLEKVLEARKNRQVTKENEKDKGYDVEPEDLSIKPFNLQVTDELLLVHSAVQQNHVIALIRHYDEHTTPQKNCFDSGWFEVFNRYI